MQAFMITKYKWNKLFLLLFFFGGLVMSSDIDIKTRKIIAETMQQKLNVNEKDIKYIDVNKVDWPSSALGCAVKGHYYLPVITPGYRVKIEADGKFYTLHTSNSKAILCDLAKPLKTSNNKQPSLELTRKVSAIQLSRLSLLKQYSKESGAVKLLNVVKRDWQQIKQRCDSTDDFKKGSDGFYIELRYGEKKQGFYSDGNKVVNCELTDKKGPEGPNNTQ